MSLTDHSAKCVTCLVLSNQFLCLELACNCNVICRYQAVRYVSSMLCTGKGAKKIPYSGLCFDIKAYHTHRLEVLGKMHLLPVSFK